MSNLILKMKEKISNPQKTSNIIKPNINGNLKIANNLKAAKDFENKKNLITTPTVIDNGVV